MINRNRVGLGLLALFAAGLVGCSPGASPPPTVPAEPVVAEGASALQTEIAGPPVIQTPPAPRASVETAATPAAALPMATSAVQVAAAPVPATGAPAPTAEARLPQAPAQAAGQLQGLADERPAPRPTSAGTTTSRSSAVRPDPERLDPVDLASYRQQVLSAGQEGAAVAALQSELIRKHGYTLEVTGRFDPETEAAVTRFQSHMGLTPDGAVGPATWAALINHFVELPWSGPGYYRYVVMDSDSSWGTDATVAAVKRVGARWAEGGYGVRIGVNDISLPHGGPFPPHSSHRNGRDVDFRTVRSDGAEAGGTWMDSSYSRRLTQELIDLLWATGEVEMILFNDPQIRGVKPWPGHDDHLHVRFRR